MFNRKDTLDSKDMEIERLQKLNEELRTQLNTVAMDNGSIILKQLPNGEMELNGIPMDNTTEVEYYNSSQATFGELTMFRVGKEAKQREMDKLIRTHMDEIDEFKRHIDSLVQDLKFSNEANKLDKDTIKMLEKTVDDKDLEIKALNEQIVNTIEEYEKTKVELIKRYKGVITGLEEDINSWKERCLKLNNITLNGTIITKYGKVLGNQ